MRRTSARSSIIVISPLTGSLVWRDRTLQPRICRCGSRVPWFLHTICRTRQRSDLQARTTTYRKCMHLVPIERLHLIKWHLLSRACNTEAIISGFAVPDELVCTRSVLHGRVHSEFLLFWCEQLEAFRSRVDCQRSMRDISCHRLRDLTSSRSGSNVHHLVIWKSNLLIRKFWCLDRVQDCRKTRQILI